MALCEGWNSKIHTTIHIVIECNPITKSWAYLVWAPFPQLRASRPRYQPERYYCAEAHEHPSELWRRSSRVPNPMLTSKPVSSCFAQAGAQRPAENAAPLGLDSSRLPTRKRCETVFAYHRKGRTGMWTSVKRCIHSFGIEDCR